MPTLVDCTAEAADVLARAMVDEPFSLWLMPDPNEFLAIHRSLCAALVRLALDEGHVDTWGEPIVGVAVWLHRPAVEPDGPRSGKEPARQLGGSSAFPAHATERVKRFAAVIRQLREHARPDEHAYLDTMAVLPEYRRRGIASRLLEAGHAWADAGGLPCALDTETAQNVAFYGRRGYSVIAELPLPGSGLTVSAMRRIAPWSKERASHPTRG